MTTSTVRTSVPPESGPQKDVIEALRCALQAADPFRFVTTNVRLEGDILHVRSLMIDLKEFHRVIIIGAGKASASMAVALGSVLGGRITSGLVMIPKYQKSKTAYGNVTFVKAAHPVPTHSGVNGARRMLGMIGRPSEDDLVLCLVSGGGSALMPMPVVGVSLREKQEVTRLLLESGARINEINAVRKHLSEVKGGRLAEKLYPATVVSLIISDVVGDDLGSIASGPTVPDASTYADAVGILQRLNLWTRIPPGPRQVLEQGVAGDVKETPKPNSPVFRNVRNIVLGNVSDSCLAAAAFLKGAGYTPYVLTTRLQGEARDVAKIVTSVFTNIAANGVPMKPPAAIVAGGETTVTVRGDGVGGRNQELALAVALGIRGMKNVCFASMGTDGLDGPTDAAGAMVDGDTITRGEKLGLDASSFLDRNDSYTFMKRMRCQIVTGPTGTNVSDIAVGIIG